MLTKLSPEQVLLRWVRHTLSRADTDTDMLPGYERGQGLTIRSWTDFKVRPFPPLRPQFMF